MNYENILLSIEDGIAHLRLNRPAKRNAVNNGLLQDIEAALDGMGADATVVVISGEGAHFSAGLDLSEHQVRTPFEVLQHSQWWHRVFHKVQFGGRPVVAALHGAVVGGGLELATSTHVRVAGRSTFYQLPEGQRGIFVGGGASVRVSKIVGPDRMTEMMLTGRRYDAEDGYRLGLSHYLVDDAEVLPEAFRLARQIATNAPLSNWASINAVANIGDMSMANGLYTESMAAALAQSSDEANKRMQDFLNRKKG
ncbi:MAG: crotonase/enoyl-CoA hydratase family protein [Zoogloea sp.]|uniref:crotonase/enoyl-CoA hydratase family protein n=1 Tax=Zoogloea sp. TaxID=49181 RepID=UPI001A493B3F|nr:crotonase/enoyl-CoA hydratase family protein [Zoogloea sp.]MBL8435829.1 crotonase/enoyl-CoA hydratase family protein [Zoogloea sp.]MDD3328534.1 crotonase/enoyl-CoA hydratase family protein [Zoogloea sp.]